MKNIVLALRLAFASTAASAQTPVTLKASDGLTLKATYYPAAKPGPGIVLLHQCNQGKRAWAGFAAKAAARGYHVIAMDYRGFGESDGPRNPDAAEQQSTVAQKWPGDVDAPFSWLLAQPGVDKNRIGAAGASCGVNQAVLLSSRHPEVTGLVLLSGTVTPAARMHLQKSSTLPILAAASADDGDVVNTMRWILGWSHDPRNTFLQFKVAGHGTDMFAVEKGLEPQLLDWFDVTLIHAQTAQTAPMTAPVQPSAVEEFWTILAQPGGAAKARALNPQSSNAYDCLSGACLADSQANP